MKRGHEGQNVDHLAEFDVHVGTGCVGDEVREAPEPLMPQRTDHGLATRSVTAPMVSPSSTLIISGTRFETMPADFFSAAVVRAETGSETKHSGVLLFSR